MILLLMFSLILVLLVIIQLLVLATYAYLCNNSSCYLCYLLVKVLILVLTTC